MNMKHLFSRVKAALQTIRSLFRSREDMALENLALRQQVAVLKRENPRPNIRWFDRAFWVGLRRIWSNWINALIIVKPETVVSWHKQGYKLYWNAISRKGRRRGRPRKDREIRNLILQIARENSTWGAPKVHAELLMLGFDVSERTVSRYLPKHESNPDKIAQWKTFWKNHKDEIAAMDFFMVPNVTFRQLYGFFIIRHKRREIIHFAATFNPTEIWVAQQLRNAFPYDTAVKYLIFDRDSIFSKYVAHVVKSLGIKPVRTSYHSPWQNGIAERWVGNCRRDLLDHLIVFGDIHLYRLLKSYVAYYNEDRCHYNLGKDAPIHRTAQSRPDGKTEIISLPRVGGLHHRYEWRQAA